MLRIRALKHHPPRVWLAIAAAGGLGSLARYTVTSEGGWLAIVVVNIAGCALLGTLVARGRATPALATGLCGGLTTFSGVAAQAEAAQRGAGPGLLRAADGTLPLSGPAAMLAILAVNALLGLAAFLAARAAAAAGSSTPPAETTTQELQG